LDAMAEAAEPDFLSSYVFRVQFNVATKFVLVLVIES
jgi:hypothetical protein